MAFRKAGMLVKVVLTLIAITSTAWCQHESMRRCSRAAASCHLAPEATEGPYYWNSTVRRDITEGKRGIPFRLTVTVLDTTTCSPMSDALVDVWQCDAEGIYSHYIAASLGESGGRSRPDNSTFFRGQQVTNSRGIAFFDTVYPGWYPRRATHIHVKVHAGASLTNIGGAIYARGGHVSYIGQLFFNDTLTDEVAKLSPYTLQKIRRTRNNEDMIYSEPEGATMILPIEYLTANGLRGPIKSDITLGVNPNAISSLGWRPPQSSTRGTVRPPSGR